MKKVSIGPAKIQAPAVVVGCMRFSAMEPDALNRLIHTALDLGANWFDHADIYGAGRSEELFGEVMKADSGLRREDMFLQSKCGICSRGWDWPHYDQSAVHIIRSVEGSLKRLRTDHLDMLLLHRPDALVESEEVASAFDSLEKEGKVLHFGISNHKPSQIMLLKKAVRQDLCVDQLRFSLAAPQMVTNGLEVNMATDGAVERDGSVLDWCRLNDVTVQAWSPFQRPDRKGTFLGGNASQELNTALSEVAEAHGTTDTAIASAWISRHPAGMQTVSGTTNPGRLAEIVRGSDITLTRDEWYRLYLAGGHILP